MVDVNAFFDLYTASDHCHATLTSLFAASLSHQKKICNRNPLRFLMIYSYARQH